jgi:hypothetical protein
VNWVGEALGGGVWRAETVDVTAAFAEPGIDPSRTALYLKAAA